MDQTNHLPSGSSTRTPAVSHWHAGYNQPGYLPDAEPGTYASFEAAAEALACDMEAHADAQETWADPHDCDDIPCPTYGEDCPWQQAAAIRSERDDLVDSDSPEWSSSTGGLAYWVTVCYEAECVSDLVAQIANEFSEDPACALHALAVSGAILPGTAAEADEHRQAASTGDESDLELLYGYITAVGERGPVAGWPKR